MLKRLYIEQFVIIETLEIEFQGNLTIMTGETGAGKSILLGAMGLVLGEESKKEAIRAGSSESIIEATLAPDKSHEIWAFLIKHELSGTADDSFTIRRVIRNNANEDILFNNKPVALELLQEIGTYLVEIHGQFANQSLLGADNQLYLLDMSGNFPAEIFDNVRNALHEVKRLTQELEEEKGFLLRHKRHLQTIEGLVRTFQTMDMRVGFVKATQEDYERLLIAKETSQAFQNILSQLISASGAVVTLSTANQTLAKQQNMERDKLGDLTNYLAEALNNARSAVNEMNRLSPDYDIDTEPLREKKEILDTLNKISTEHKISMDEMEDFAEEMANKLYRLRNGRETMEKLEADLQIAKGNYIEHAKVLTEKRTEAAKKLGTAITNELPPLKLNKAEFMVEVKEDTAMEWTELGLNKVTFMARMNPGQDFSPIAETASGGELARLILGLKVVLQRVQTTPTLVFDEVDTGIGGAAAAAVGERLALLSEKTQVLVITHSPQVAARGNQHLHVSKSTDGVTTVSTVHTLSMDDRIDEISRMLSGDVITEEAQAAARSLIEEASKAASLRHTESNSYLPHSA